MDAAEITRRLEIAKLAVEYYSALERGEPFEVQYRRGGNNWCNCTEPDFRSELDYRRKPKEPRRLTLYRYGNFWKDVLQYGARCDETVEFIEVLPTPEPPKEPKRWWARIIKLPDDPQPAEFYPAEFYSEETACRDEAGKYGGRVVQVVEVEP